MTITIDELIHLKTVLSLECDRTKESLERFGDDEKFKALCLPHYKLESALVEKLGTALRTGSKRITISG